MSDETIKKVAEVMCNADHGCSSCVIDLLQKFVEKFGLEEERVFPIFKEAAHTQGVDIDYMFVIDPPSNN